MPPPHEPTSAIAPQALRSLGAYLSEPLNKTDSYQSIRMSVFGRVTHGRPISGKKTFLA